MDENNQEQAAAEVQPQGEQTTAESEAEVIDRKAFEDQRKRAEKAESKLKELKAALAEKEEQSSEKKEEAKAEPTLTAEEIRLIAKYDDDGLEKLRKIAAVEGVSLKEAANTDLFQSWQQSQEEKKRNEQAQLRASRSAGSSQAPKSFRDAGKDPKEFDKMLKAYLRQQRSR